MKTLLTGCAGFIGSHLADALVARGDEVLGLDNFDPHYNPELKRENIAGLAGNPRFSLIEGDIRDARLIADVLERNRPDAIIHLAAKVGVRPSLRSPEEYASVNVLGTVTLLEAARQHGVNRLVFASSSSVYGVAGEGPSSEDQPLCPPISPYAASKVGAEAFCHAYHQAHGMRIAIPRFFTVYGPRQRPDLAINTFVRLMLAGKPIPMYGDGSSGRDYTYIADIVAGVLAALDADLAFEIINLGGGSPVLLKDLIAAIGEALGCEPRIEQLAEQPGDLPMTHADISQAKRILEWKPKTGIAEGIARFVAWYKSQS